MARPSSFTLEIAAHICDQVALGSNLDRICAIEGTPDKASVYKWFREHPEFFNDYARARELRADSRSDRIDGHVELVVAGKLDANAARVIIDAEKWQAAHEQPRRYGDATMLKHADADGNKLPTFEVSTVARKKKDDQR